MTRDEFIQQAMPHAMRVAKATGLDPRLIIAQAANESGYGAHAPGNNYFGVKSHERPGGQSLATTEVINGKSVRMKQPFRSYKDMGESFDDYGRFLQKNPRYRDLLKAPDLNSQVAALAASGYATDPKYGDKIMKIANSVGGDGKVLTAAADASATKPIPGTPTGGGYIYPNPKADGGVSPTGFGATLASAAPVGGLLSPSQLAPVKAPAQPAVPAPASPAPVPVASNATLPTMARAGGGGLLSAIGDAIVSPAAAADNPPVPANAMPSGPVNTAADSAKVGNPLNPAYAPGGLIDYHKSRIPTDFTQPNPVTNAFRTGSQGLDSIGQTAQSGILPAWQNDFSGWVNAQQQLEKRGADKPPVAGAYDNFPPMIGSREPAPAPAPAPVVAAPVPPVVPAPAAPTAPVPPEAAKPVAPPPVQPVAPTPVQPVVPAPETKPPVVQPPSLLAPKVEPKAVPPMSPFIQPPSLLAPKPSFGNVPSSMTDPSMDLLAPPALPDTSMRVRPPETVMPTPKLVTPDFQPAGPAPLAGAPLVPGDMTNMPPGWSTMPTQGIGGLIRPDGERQFPQEAPPTTVSLDQAVPQTVPITPMTEGGGLLGGGVGPYDFVRHGPAAGGVSMPQVNPVNVPNVVQPPASLQTVTDNPPPAASHGGNWDSTTTLEGEDQAKKQADMQRYLELAKGLTDFGTKLALMGSRTGPQIQGGSAPASFHAGGGGGGQPLPSLMRTQLTRPGSVAIPTGISGFPRGLL